MNSDNAPAPEKTHVEWALEFYLDLMKQGPFPKSLAVEPAAPEPKEVVVWEGGVLWHGKKRRCIVSIVGSRVSYAVWDDSKPSLIRPEWSGFYGGAAQDAILALHARAVAAEARIENMWNAYRAYETECGASYEPARMKANIEAAKPVFILAIIDQLKATNPTRQMEDDWEAKWAEEHRARKAAEEKVAKEQDRKIDLEESLAKISHEARRFPRETVDPAKLIEEIKKACDGALNTNDTKETNHG